MTSAITNDCSIPATKVAGIEYSLVITLVIRSQRVKLGRTVRNNSYVWLVKDFFNTKFLTINAISHQGSHVLHLVYHIFKNIFDKNLISFNS